MMKNVSPEFAEILNECLVFITEPHKEEMISAIINTLAEKGWSICPPGHILLPSSVQIAEITTLACEAYIKGHLDATPEKA